MNQSKLLDLTPLETKAHQFKFRERNKSKEIGPEMRFQAKNNAERILDFINFNGLAQLQVSFYQGFELPLLPKVFYNIAHSIKNHRGYSKNH